jgi:hypothetical protein
MEMDYKTYLRILMLLFLVCMPVSLLASPTVQVKGLRIIADGYGDDMSMRPFNWTKGTAVALLVQRPGGGIVSFDKDKSELTAFTDDLGTNLLEKSQESNSYSSSGFEMSPDVSKDGSAMMTEISAPQTPAAGARSAKVTGKLVLMVATKKESHTIKAVSLTAGTPIVAGPLKLEVHSTGKPEWGSDEYPFAVTLKGSGGFDSVISVAFAAADGSEVTSKTGSRMWMTIGGVKTVRQEYQLTRPIDKANITIHRWTDLHAEDVPLNISFGVGMGG